jgi:hypothetical protein
MTEKPDAGPASNATDIVATATPDEYRTAANVLHFAQCGFLVQAWRINRSDPAQLTLVGALYTYTSSARPMVTLDAPRIILGRDPATPARLAARLITRPSGAPETWTSVALAAQEIELDVPKVEPWVPAALTVRLKNRRCYT